MSQKRSPGPRIVIDTNNLISALGWEGLSCELMRKVLAKNYSFIISHQQLTELQRVLNYPKFKFSQTQKHTFLEIIVNTATIVETHSTLNILKDESDNRIIECALDGGADYIITGDKELLKLKKVEGVKIISVNEFLRK